MKKQMKIIREICIPMKSIIIALIIVGSILPSCKKYPDGPTISLLPRRERIEGKWVATSVKYNQNDSTAAYKNNIWEFTRQYSVILQVNSLKFIGQWSTQTNDKDFVIDYDGGARNTYKILRLTDKEFVILDKKSQLEFHLAPQ
jgi:Lipocalin-like domain